MSDYAFFYNSENGDRKYNADSFEKWLKKFFTTGVFEGECQVLASGGMSVSVSAGYANIDGKVKVFDSAEVLPVENADAVYNRIDTVVIERNDTERDFLVKVIKGGLASEPVPIRPVRSAGIYQIVLAEIYVASGTTAITQSMITDKRMDSSVCGYVTGTVEEIDFSQITEQFLTWESEFQATVIDWFNHLQELISEDIAVRLQLEIGELSQLQTQDKSNLVNAINEVLNSTDESIYEKVDGIIGTDEEWNRTKSYSVGNMVLHNNKLWSCKLQHSGQEPPNSTYWENVSLSQINNDLQQRGKIVFSQELSSVTLQRETNPTTVFTIEEDGLYAIMWGGAGAHSRMLVINGAYYDISQVGSDVVIEQLKAGSTIAIAYNGYGGEIMYRHKMKIIKLY